jgi:hypothetical protein
MLLIWHERLHHSLLHPLATLRHQDIEGGVGVQSAGSCLGLHIRSRGHKVEPLSTVDTAVWALTESPLTACGP